MTTQYRAILKNKSCTFDCKLFPIGVTIENVIEWARGRGGTYNLFIMEETEGDLEFGVDEYPEVYRIKGDKVTYHGFARTI